MAVKDETYNDQFFKTDHLELQIKSLSVRGGVVTIVAQGIKFGLSIGSTMVLARLLTPQDYGLFGMVIAITGFLVMFKDMGLSMATVQRKEINQKQISTLFWINVAFSILLMLITAALSPVIAWFYGKPSLTWVTLTLAIGFIFSGLTVQPQALLKRQMRFFAIAAIDLIAVLVGIIVAIVTALYGANYWALVIQQLSMAFVLFAGVWIMCGWRPSLPSQQSGVRPMLAFGANLVGFNLLNYFGRNLDKVLIGRYCGSRELGLYGKAYQLLLLPIQQIITPITNVVIPALSRLQSDPVNYRRYYCTILNSIAFITTPLTLTLAALSYETILIVLGKQWIESNMIFKVLAIAALGQSVGSTTGWIFISLGQTNRMMRWAMISMPLYTLSFLIGLPWGALGVAISYTICDHIIRIPLLFYAFKYSPITVSNFIESIWRPILISIFMYTAMVLTKMFLKPMNPFLTISVCLIVGFSVYLLFILSWQKARFEIYNFVKIYKIFRGER